MRKSNLNGLKISMAAASLVLTLIIWNLFSSKALEDALKTAQDQNQPQIQPGSTLSDMAPLPTLVPLQFSLAAEPVQPVSVQPLPAAQPTQALRKMSVPTPSAAPQKPIVHQVVINVGGGGGGGGSSASGGGGGAAPAPVTSTGSSKK